MPNYDYECPECGTFEIEQKITEEALKVCPKCGKEIQRKISISTFILKGDGWYESDYKNKK